MMMFYHILFGFNNVHYRGGGLSPTHLVLVHSLGCVLPRQYHSCVTNLDGYRLPHRLLVAKLCLNCVVYHSLNGTPKCEDQPQLLPDLLDQDEWMAVAMKAQRDKTGNVMNVEGV